MSPRTTKQPQSSAQRERDLQHIASGIMPHASMSRAAIDADTESHVERFDAEIGRLHDIANNKRREIAADSNLTDQGKKAKLDDVTAAHRADLLNTARRPVPWLASRLRAARESFGAGGELVTGREIARRLLGGRTTDGWLDTRGRMVARSMDVALDELRQLARDGAGEEVHSVLVDAADHGDLTTWAAVDHAPSWVRARILAVAAIDADADARLHRRLRSALDPEGAATVDALHELSRHFLANVRSAFDAASIAGLDGSPVTSERRQPEHDARLAETLAPLVDELRGLSDVPETTAPATDPD